MYLYMYVYVCYVYDELANHNLVHCNTLNKIIQIQFDLTMEIKSNETG